MVDTVNTPGILCFPAFSADVGWQQSMAGFTDECFTCQWLRVKLPAGQSAPFQWMEDPGVLCSTQWGFVTENRWNFSLRIGLANVSVFAKFNPTIVAGNPATQILVDLAWVPDFGPNKVDQYNFDRINVSKKTPWTSDGCQPIVGGPGCTSTGPLVLDWWQSCDGTPAAGPTVPA